jgi:hypothetical protein
MVLKIATMKGMNFAKEFFTAYRAKPKARNDDAKDQQTHPLIIIKFHNKLIKNTYKKRIQGTDIHIHQLSPSFDPDRYENNNDIIYINENLTKEQRSIFYATRQARKAGLFKHTWTSDGNIFIKKTDHSSPVQIHNHADLETWKAANPPAAPEAAVEEEERAAAAKEAAEEEERLAAAP